MNLRNMMANKVKHSYNILTDSITFKCAKKNNHSRKVLTHQALVFKNISVLGNELKDKLVSYLSDGEDLDDFFDYKKNGASLYFKEVQKRHVISLSKSHVALIDRILSCGHNHLGIGNILLMDMVFSGIITDREHLGLLLDNQGMAMTNIYLSEDFELYSLPHYCTMTPSFYGNQRSSVDVSTDFAKRMMDSNPRFILSAFLGDDRGLSFGEFMKEPEVDFNSSFAFDGIRTSLDWYNESKEHLTQDFLFQIDRQTFLNISECSLFLSEFIDQVQDSDTRIKHNLRTFSVEDMNKVFINSENLDRILTIIRSDKNMHYRGVHHNRVFRYYLYYLMANNSLGDVEELLQLFNDTEDKDFFLNEMNLIKLMEYFDNERTMSLDMWVILNDVIDTDDD